MWTVFRFALSGADDRAYREAYDILRGAGFARASEVAAPSDLGSFPAAVVADVTQDPSAVTRVIFAALAEARLRPLAVTGCPAAWEPRLEAGATAA